MKESISRRAAIARMAIAAAAAATPLLAAPARAHTEKPHEAATGLVIKEQKDWGIAGDAKLAQRRFVIGTKSENAKHADLMVRFLNMEHDEPHMAHLPPGKTGEVVWTVGADPNLSHRADRMLGQGWPGRPSRTSAGASRCTFTKPRTHRTPSRSSSCPPTMWTSARSWRASARPR